MRSTPDIYVPGTGPLYRLDARVKVLLLVAFSVAVFFVETWLGLGVLFALLLLAALSGRLPLLRLVSMASPVLVLLSLIVVCNSLTGPDGSGGLAHLSGVSAGFADGAPLIPLCSVVSFGPEGFVKGLFYLFRIVLVVWASFVLAFTTRSVQLTRAFSSLLSPLRFMRLPVDDIAMVCSLVLRFIPLAWSSYARIRDAQISRAARYDEGGLWSKVRGYVSLMIPLFVSLFRQADRLAEAMDARCYALGAKGQGVRRSSLDNEKISVSDVVILLGGLVCLVCCAFAF